MFRRILADPSLPVILSRMDFDLAEQARAGGCAHCGGRLHSARYPRKPRWDRVLDPDWGWRWSFCCAVCRRRTTPASVRFLGRHVYPAVVVVLVTALAQGLSGRRLGTLRSAIGVDRRTLLRWRAWWRETFPQTRFWKEARVRFLPAVDRESLPRSLLIRFSQGTVEGIVSLLRFMAPWSLPDPVFRGS
jgi:hypothetical protein